MTPKNEIMRALQIQAEAFRDLTSAIHAFCDGDVVAPISSESTLRFASLEIDEAVRLVYVDKCEVVLKPREYTLLLTLARNPRIAISRDRLLEQAWGRNYSGYDGTIPTHIHRLRKNLGKYNPRVARYIQTLHRYGYRFMPDAQGAADRECVA
jgi:DNA-binding response OmpR family regulator